MAKYKAVLESKYYGADEEYEFEAPNNATEEELSDLAFETIKQNIEWYWELAESGAEDD